MLPIILTFLCAYGAIGAELKITTAQGLIDLSNAVNKGTSYSGTTVILDSDLSLSGKTFVPIGTKSNYFSGTFDGQGHVISNLKISSSISFVGLFGFSYGMTVKNVILDSSCSITNLYSGSDWSYSGGIIGCCSPSNRDCISESNVNMASVSFSGAVSGNYNVFIGGIAGGFESSSSSYKLTIKNCANYGSLTSSGSSESFIEMGGIAGSAHSSSIRGYVQNCVNFGSISHTGTSKYLVQGGIAGLSYYLITIDNCLSAGKISSSGTYSTRYVGNNVGLISSGSTDINYCYYTSDVGASSLYGYGTPKSTSGSSTSSITVSTAVSNLNSRASSNGWNKWLLNSNSVNVWFKFNNNKWFSISKKVVLLPNLSPTGSNTFSGWYMNTNYNEVTQPTSVSSSTDLYGLYGIISTVSFNSNGGDSPSFSSKKVVYGLTYGNIPTIGTRTGYTFDGWYTSSSGGSKVETGTKVTTKSSQTLYAHWTAIKSTVTFDKNGGDSVSETTMTVTYDGTYGNLPNAEKIGYTFEGWYTSSSGGNEIKSATKVTITSSQTLYAHWSPIKSNVTFDVNGGDSASETTMTVAYDSTYGTLPTAEKVGYTFFGWFTEAEGGDKIESTTKVNITAPQTIYAHWKANTYTITFNTTAEDVPQQPPQQGTYDSEYGTLPELERIGYTFAGWFTEEDGQGERITEGTNVTIAGNHTLYAHWSINHYSITFIFGNGAEFSVALDFNEPINYPENAVREGYTFAGWSPNPDNVPAEDLTINALWTPKEYIITFNVNGGNALSESESKKEVIYDDIYGELPESERTGYSFAGWFTEEEGGYKITNETEVKITENKTLYARWSINKYTIIFEVDGGSECENITQDYNTEVVLPEPTKTGYTFDCWCSDPELSREYTETTMPARNVTLYAKWTINQYNLTIIFNNGTENEVRILDFNEKIEYPENPVRVGYTFSEWDKKPDMMPAENITISAQWVENVKPEEPSGSGKSPESVEIVFGKSFTVEEVRDILEDYTKEGFIIVEFERDEETGETRVVVKFSDSKKAEEFTENITENGKEEHFFRDANFVSEKNSFISTFSPLFLLHLIF